MTGRLKKLLRSVWLRRKVEAEIDSELETFVELAAAEKVAGGLSPAEARRQALIELGGREQVKESVRRARATAPFDELVRDLRYAVRTLGRSPLFTLVIVATLALAIGANTAVFTVANALLLRTPPGIEAPRDLVELSRGSGTDYVDLSYPMLLHLRNTTRTLHDLAALRPAVFSIGGSEGPEVIQGYQVSGNYFSVLGVEPFRGRLFVEDEWFYPNEPDGVVISHRLWQQRLGSSSSVLEQELIVNGFSARILGVLPAGFRGHVGALFGDVFVVMGTPVPGLFEGERLLDPRDADMSGIARLASGSSPSLAAKELTDLANQFSAEILGGDDFVVRAEAYGPFPGMMRKQAGTFFAALLIIVGLLLAIASVNVTNMLLSRAVDRAREVSIRLAMGAGPGRILRQLLIETLVLFLIAGGAGIVLALWLSRLASNALPPLPIPVDLDLSGDLRVAAYGFGLTMAAGLLSGLAPAFRSLEPGVASLLSVQAASAWVGRNRARRFLVAFQMAATILLLIASGLFVRALGRVATFDLGFESDNVEMATFDLEIAGYDSGRAIAFYDQLLRRTASAPGIESAALSHKAPLASISSLGGIQIPGVEPPNEWGFSAHFLVVGGDYFETLRISLLDGRFPDHLEGGQSPRSAVLNRTMAERLWGRPDPVGELFWLGTAEQRIEYRVDGVVADAKYHSPNEPTPNFMYLPLEQQAPMRWSPMQLLLRSSSGGQLGRDALSAIVDEIDPNVPVLSTAPLSAVLSRASLPQRFAAWVTGAVGLVGLLLGAVGIYGVTAYAVNRKRHEIGVRLAMGADQRAVVRSVVGGGMRWPLFGMLVGTLLAAALSRFLGGFLMGVSPLDPWTFSGVLLLLIGVALVATLVPARNAARLDPMTTLRTD